LVPLKIRDVIRLLEEKRLASCANKRRSSGVSKPGRQNHSGSWKGRRGCEARYLSRHFEANWYQGPEAVTRKYSLVIEGDSKGYSAYVPELPAILVTGQSMDELTARAVKAIRVYWESVRADRSPTSTIREIEVDLPA
jgi:predicted RNase H-like HicB family nuclease